MAEKKKFGPGFTKKEIEAAKKRRLERRLREEEKRTGLKLRGRAAPKPFGKSRLRPEATIKDPAADVKTRTQIMKEKLKRKKRAK